MAKDEKIPEDLGLKLGTKAFVLWEEVLKTAKTQVEACEREILIQKEIVILAEKKLEEEKRKV